MGNEQVNYINYGGVLVPENSRRFTVTGKKGQTLYCVFLDDKGTRATYPKQTKGAQNETQYLQFSYDYNPFTHKEQTHTRNISKADFDKIWSDNTDPNSVKEFYNTPENGSKEYRHIKQNYIGGSYYLEKPVDPSPKIEYENDSGILFDTKKIKVSNLKGASIKGSSDEDVITVENSENCTIDVSYDNNNIVCSDNVKIVNGKKNKVISGSWDKTSFTTFNYSENTENTKAKHNGEGIFHQP